MTPVYRLSQAGSIKTGRTNYPNMGVGVSSVAVPFAPTIGTATATNTASVAFTPSVIGAAATTYTATSSPGGITGTASSSPITVSGLTAGTAYTFTVTASNANGTSSASAASNSVTPVSLNSFESIQTATPTGSSTISLGSIPSTYKHLQLRIFGVHSANADAVIKFNSDNAQNYVTHQLYALGSGTPSASFLGTSYGPGIYIDGGGISSSGPAVAIVDILDYQNTSKNKTVRIAWGFDNNGSGRVGIDSGLWMSTAAISQIDITGRTFNSGSRIALYGIKG